METKEKKPFINPSAVYRAVEARAVAQAQEAEAELVAARDRLYRSGIPTATCDVMSREQTTWHSWKIEAAATALLKAAGLL